MNIKSIFLIFLIFFCCCFSQSQNEAQKWYFGDHAGLDFMTSPPTVLNNGSTSILAFTGESACVSNAAGNLLFYTDGKTVWNQTHAIMANGQFLLGNSDFSQSALIVKQPGNTNLYFIFTIHQSLGLNYSIVDMNLAAGMGSVTVKNAPLYSNPSDNRITGTKHCNGTDFWVLIREVNPNNTISGNFRSYLLTTAGVSSVAVTSTSHYTGGGTGAIKISPNGRKLGLVSYSTYDAYLYDFDNSTGVISNSLSLLPGWPIAYWGVGCEFSPDGTKFYASSNGNEGIKQWDLCAGSNTAIVGSVKTFQVYNGALAAAIGHIQLAPNGKIYMAQTNFMVVINNPNLVWPACNAALGPNLFPGNGSESIPNFIDSYFLQSLVSPPFTHSVNTLAGCKTATFMAPPQPSVYCAAAGYSINSILWKFGDPASGAANTSTLSNPSHLFSSTGTFNTQLILYYSCSGGIDTLNQTITIIQPTLSLSNSPVTCAGLGSSTVMVTGGTGSYNYTWAPSSQTNSVGSGLVAGNYTVSVYDVGAGCTTTITTAITNNYVFTGTTSPVNLLCNGINTGSASVMVTGGTGSYNYFWSPTAQTNSVATGLAAGIYTVTVSDQISPCSLTNTVQLMQPPAVTLNISANTLTNCIGGSVHLIASSLGGTPSYLYSWATGPALANYTVTESLVGTYVYSVNSTDANNCFVSNTIAIVYTGAPILTVPNVTICNGYVATLNISGANSYTWQPSGLTGSTFTTNPTSTTVYSVTGNAIGCTANNVATPTVVVVPPPSLTVSLSGNGTLCAQAFNGSPNTITLTSGGAATYTLKTPTHILNNNPNGPSSPLSTLPPFTSGPATATLVGSNGYCTTTKTVSFNVIQNPSLTVNTPTPVICTGKSFTYTSSGASSYTWGPGTPGLSTYTGPVTIASPTVTSVYSVIGGSLGCNSGTQTSTITVNLLPTISITPKYPGICLGNRIDLTAIGSGTSFTWSPNLALNTTTGAVVSAGPITQQTYQVMASLNSCTQVAMVTVSIIPLPIPEITLPKTRVCVNDVITLIGKGGDTYNWTGPNNLLYAGQTVSFVAHSLNYSGTYILNVTDGNNCKNKTTADLIVVDLPYGSLIPNSKYNCVPFTSEFTFDSHTKPTTFWTLENSSYTGNKFSHLFTVPGEYLITGHLQDTSTSCVNTVTFLLNAYPVPKADFKFLPEKPVESLETVIFTNNSTGDFQNKWNWFFIANNGFKSSNENTSYFFQDAGLYPVAFKVQNKYGCSDTIVKTIKVESDFNIYVPNAFTPNGDELNDIFLPILRGTKFYTLSVFDRWGAKLFETNNTEAGWDGSYRGEEAKQDVYVWKITVSSNSGEQKTLTGQVTLTR